MDINRSLIADCAKPRKNPEESDPSRILARARRIWSVRSVSSGEDIASPSHSGT